MEQLTQAERSARIIPGEIAQEVVAIGREEQLLTKVDYGEQFDSPDGRRVLNSRNRLGDAGEQFDSPDGWRVHNSRNRLGGICWDGTLVTTLVTRRPRRNVFRNL